MPPPTNARRRSAARRDSDRRAGGPAGRREHPRDPGEEHEREDRLLPRGGGVVRVVPQRGERRGAGSTARAARGATTPRSGRLGPRGAHAAQRTVSPSAEAAARRSRSRRRSRWSRSCARSHDCVGQRPASPAHVTLPLPVRRRPRKCRSTSARQLRERFRRRAANAFELARARRRCPEVAWLAPEPSEPFNGD